MGSSFGQLCELWGTLGALGRSSPPATVIIRAWREKLREKSLLSPVRPAVLAAQPHLLWERKGQNWRSWRGEKIVCVSSRRRYGTIVSCCLSTCGKNNKLMK